MGKAHNHAMGMAGEVAFKAGQDMLIGLVKDGLIGGDMLPEGMELPEGFGPPPMPPGPIGAAGIIPPGGQELPPLPAGMENIAQDMVNNVPMPNMPPLADGAMPPMPNMPPIPEGMKNMAADMAGQQAGQMAADKIQSLLDSKNIYSRIIKLPLGHDPGDITKDVAEAALK